jgi:hypothetical protein
MLKNRKDEELDETEEIEILEDEVLDEELDDDSDIDDNDVDEDEEEDEGDIMFKFNTNNHKIEGKHALSRDTIFKGKLENNETEHLTAQSDFNSNDGLPIEIESSFEYESKFNEEYTSRLKLQQDIYELLSTKTSLDFSSNRRKPNRQAFNGYYKMLLDNIGKDYTKSEIFVELSYYFTDNIFNMFKLLDKESATQIIVELKQSGYLTNLNNIKFI